MIEFGEKSAQFAQRCLLPAGDQNADIVEGQILRRHLERRAAAAVDPCQHRNRLISLAI